VDIERVRREFADGGLLACFVNGLGVAGALRRS